MSVLTDEHITQARNSLTSLARELAQRDDVKQRLANSKSRANELERDDFVWYELLLSFSTMGNSRGKHGLIDNEENFARVQFDRLKRLSSSEARLAEFREVLHLAKVRMPEKKAVWLLAAFDRIAAMGGLNGAKAELEKRNGREGKIQFWREFDGIGEKFSRNIMMDVYHPEFRDSIAVDVRIKKIAKTLGLNFRNYSDAEEFFLSVAHQAGMNGWELDRMMYRFEADFIKGFQSA